MNLGRPAPPPTYPEWPELVAAAEAKVAAERFVNPSAVFVLERMTQRRGYDWCTAVLGYAWPGARFISSVHAEVLRLADERDLDPPLPRYITEGRERERLRREAVEKMRDDRARRRAAEWQAVIDGLPFGVLVCHNYESHRHLEGYVQGGDHILVTEDMRHGRLARDRGRSLCETPSYSKNLYFPDFPDFAEKRIPTCKKCIRTAARIAGVDTPTLLAQDNR